MRVPWMSQVRVQEIQAQEGIVNCFICGKLAARVRDSNMFMCTNLKCGEAPVKPVSSTTKVALAALVVSIAVLLLL